LCAHNTEEFLFDFITLSFSLILGIALALDGRNTHAEPTDWNVLSDEKSLAPAAVTRVCSVIKLTHAIPATATRAQASSGCGVILDENGLYLGHRYQAL
jgi:hypothetical protein